MGGGHLHPVTAHSRQHAAHALAPPVSEVGGNRHQPVDGLLLQITLVQ